MPDLPTAAQRVVEAAARKGVQLTIVEFDESTHTAQEAARAVGAELGQIVKSLVFVIERDEGIEPILVLASGANMVNLGLLSAVLTEPRLRRATADEARALTGFSIGGIPPFGHARPIRTLMDPDLGRFPSVWAAAGTPNSVFNVSPASLRMLANATVAPIASPAMRSGQAATDEPPPQNGPLVPPTGAASAPSGA